MVISTCKYYITLFFQYFNQLSFKHIIFRYIYLEFFTAIFKNKLKYKIKHASIRYNVSMQTFNKYKENEHHI